MCLQDEVERGIEEEGSNLSGVTSRCSWEQYSVSRSNSDDSIQDGHQVALRGCTGGNLGSDRAPLTPFGRSCDVDAGHVTYQLVHLLITF